MRYLHLIAIALLLIFITLACIHSLNSINQDIGRHLKLGQIIWETKSVPKTNLFSFTEPDHPFINHHWLSEVIFYLLFGIIGLKGLIIFKAVVVAISFLLIYKAADKKTGLWPFLVSAPLGMLVFLSRSDVRPEIFSYLFLAFFIFAILRARFFGQYHWLYALPFIQVLWSNAHIYFVLGPALLFFFLIDTALTPAKNRPAQATTATPPARQISNEADPERSHDNSQRASASYGVNKENKVALSKIFWIFIATSAVTLLNPNFIKGALAPFFILKEYGYSIVENQSIFFLKDYGAMLATINAFEFSLIILILSFVIAFKNGGRKIVFELLTGLAFSILAVKMIRNTGVYALVFTSITALNLSTQKPAGALSKLPVKVIFYLAFLAIFAFLITNVLNNNLRRWMQEGGKFGLEIPTGAAQGVEFVKQNNIKGPVFNNFDVGSFLIWKLFPVRANGSQRDPTSNGTSPEFRVFVDGRPEAYSVEFFENVYKPMQEDPKMWEYYSEKYGINYVFFAHTDITPWAREFLFNISQNPNWPLVYKDASVAIFLKRTPENSALIKKFEIK
jgi:hypothetical protein